MPLPRRLSWTQAFLHRNRWARFTLYTLALLAQLLAAVVTLPFVLLGEVVLGLVWTAVDHFRHHRSVLAYLARLFRQDWRNWDKTGCLCDEVGGDIKYDVRERRWIHRRCGGRLNNGENEHASH